MLGRRIDTPVGALTIIVGTGGVGAVVWDGDLETRVKMREPIEAGDHPVLDLAAAQLVEYFECGRTHFDVPLAPRGTPFQLAVWQALRSIPYGETRTYGRLAAEIGRPDAARAVGAANGRNPISVIIPCHRVVGSTGALTGYAGGLSAKRRLLDLERSSSRR
jgi:methylated-DNA-[protein]-cysteine S-methyltransferase